MKEITKYLCKFMDGQTENRQYSLSPEYYAFFEEKTKEIIDANREWTKQRNSILIQPIDFSRNHEWKQGEHYDYLESHVKSNLSSHTKMGVKCTFPIGDQDITLYIVYPLLKTTPMKSISKKKQDTYFEKILHKVYLWLCIANKYKGESCSQTLSIYLYLTNLPKLIGKKDIIGRMHVNTGYTHACLNKNEIYIFREEEWFKVFIHETFHAFGIDFAESRWMHIQDMCEKCVHSVFKVPHVNILVFETFSEICAELINLAFVSHFDKRPIQDMLHYEIEFSAFQCAKVLAHYSMNYSDLYSESPDAIQKRGDYRENSNVISYYVLKSLLYYHLNEFMAWFVQSNGGRIRFIPTSQNTQAFCKLITTNYNRPEYVEKLDMYSAWIRTHRENSIATKTLRMTVHEI